MFCHVATVPDDVLSAAVLQRVDCVRDLCALASTSKRFRQLSGCDHLWKNLWAAKWGEPVALTIRAAALAGGYKQLFGSKTVTDKASAPWTKPCPEELKASIEKLIKRVNGDAQQVCVVFLVDGSGSVNAEEFEAMLGFVLEASTQLHANVPDCQVSVVQFSNDVRIECPLSPVDLEALRKVTQDMVRMNGGTNVAVAVHKAGQILKRDAAADAMRHVILLTDGRVDSYQAHEARQMAEQLADEQRHVSLFAYGVGRGVDRAELLHIIGGPSTCPLPASSLPSPAPGPAPIQVPAVGGAAGVAPATPTAASSTPASTAASTPASASSSSSTATTTTSMTTLSPLSGDLDSDLAVSGRAAAALSALGEAPEDRYLALCVRDEGPW